METQLYRDGDFPFTPEWYEGREHAPHREQPPHWDRMDEAARLAALAVEVYGARSIVDLGAGDGGMLATVRALVPEVPMWGYDLMEPNVMHARMARDADVRQADFLTAEIEWGDLAICTEVLEHLEHPHAFACTVAFHTRFLVASSPASETADAHAEEHAWCWNEEGYAQMIQRSGFKTILEHTTVENGDMTFQVVLAAKAAK